MSRFSSTITFLYYQDLEYGTHIIEELFGFEKIMDQGFAKVYTINDGCFVGIVQSRSDKPNNGDTLLSFNTVSIEEEYKRVKAYDVLHLTDIQRIDSIPLDSFFFDDKEGHKFEIQQFVTEEDRRRF